MSRNFIKNIHVHVIPLKLQSMRKGYIHLYDRINFAPKNIFFFTRSDLDLMIFLKRAHTYCTCIYNCTSSTKWKFKRPRQSWPLHLCDEEYSLYGYIKNKFSLKAYAFGFFTIIVYGQKIILKTSR